LNLACLDVEDRVSRISLRKDCSFPGNGHDSSALADGGKKVPWVKVGLFLAVAAGAISGSSCVELHPQILSPKPATKDALFCSELEIMLPDPLNTLLRDEMFEN